MLLNYSKELLNLKDVMSAPVEKILNAFKYGIIKEQT